MTGAQGLHSGVNLCSLLLFQDHGRVILMLCFSSPSRMMCCCQTTSSMCQGDDLVAAPKVVVVVLLHKPLRNSQWGTADARGTLWALSAEVPAQPCARWQRALRVGGRVLAASAHAWRPVHSSACTNYKWALIRIIGPSKLFVVVRVHGFVVMPKPIFPPLFDRKDRPSKRGYVDWSTIVPELFCSADLIGTACSRIAQGPCRSWCSRYRYYV
jgi:hypothetical protein